MSIQSEITRISGNVADALDAIENKGVTIPAGSNSDDLADLIGQITGGGSGGIVISDAADPAGGTVRTITAVEISGTKNITQNGTGIDVTEYAAVNVAVPAPTPDLQTKTNISPTESSQTITADAGYDGLDSVQINAIPSSYVGSGVTRRDSDDFTASGATVTAPAGYYASAATKSVASGTAGTPTASKGAVTNNSVQVTPSVTNTAGYISGGTKTGTAVTVSASELVSGSETKTANGTYDVTTLAELVVNVASSGKAVQIASGFGRVNTTTYTAVSGQSITVGKTGTYDVYWIGYRSSTSGTNGSQLYVGSTAHSSGAQTTFDGTYTNWQIVHLSNVSLTKDQVVTVRARARSTSYYMYVANLTIIEA